MMQITSIARNLQTEKPPKQPGNTASENLQITKLFHIVLRILSLHFKSPTKRQDIAFCHSLIIKNSAPCDIPRIAPILNGDFTVDIQGLTMHA